MTAPRTIGYIRVSTIEQCVDRQMAGMSPHCDRIYVEQVSAAAKARPEFTKAQRVLKRGDTFMVWDLDRAFRSTIEALKTADALRQRGVEFRIFSLGIDTLSPEGEFFYTLTAAFAQLERRMISRRTKEGLAAARARGVRLGKTPILSDAQAREAYDAMCNRAWSLTDTAAAYGVSRMTLTRAFARAGIPKFPPKERTKPP